MKTNLRGGLSVYLAVISLLFAFSINAQTSPINESFSNLGPYSGYGTETWTGDDGGTWTATDARTDQQINGKAITVRNGDLTSPLVTGGLGDLTVTTKRFYGGGSGNLTVYVNSVQVGTVPYDDTQTTSSITGINISGNVEVRIETPGNGDRIGVDDLQWTAYAGSSNDQTTEVYAPANQVEAKTVTAADVTTLANAESVFKFTVEDQGSGDGLPTNLTRIRLVPGPNNTADWTNHLQGFQVIDSNIDIHTPTATISDTEILLNFVTPVSIADAGSLDFEVFAYLNTSNIQDASILQFQIDATSHGFLANTSGSGFSSSFLLGDVVGNNITIDVEATQLSYLQQPNNVIVNEVMSPAVDIAYTDVNDNVDVDYSGAGFDISLISSASFDASATTTVEAVNGVASFTNLIFDTEVTGVNLTASDDSTFITGTYDSANFDVTAPVSGATDLFISEYIEGSGNNKYLEIYNGTGTTVDLSTYTVELYANGGTTANNTETLGNLIPVLGNGEVIVLKHSSADLSLPTGVTAHNSTVCNFNGNDAIVLKHNGSIIDIFGNIGCDPGSEWSEGGNNTQDRTLVRNTDICGGVTVNPTTACDFPTLATEWTGYPQNDVSTLGSHTANCGVSPTADYTYTSGSWSPEDPNGMALPTDNIEVLDGTATFNNAIEINNLSIATGATLEVKDVLTVNGNITNDGNIIFKSTTATKTAQLDEFNGTISGNGDVVVERFIPAKRAFRLLSSPVNGQTFADAWQQNTHITGVGGAANGFDPTPTNNPSLFIFNNSLTTQSGGAAWEAVTSTTEIINAGQGYRLMVRGDRTIDLTSQNPTPTSTTLMSKGDLTTGNYTPILAQGAGFYSLIGNPYQAIVDFSQLTISGDINNSNIYVWDPTMTGSNGRGAYVTVDVTSTSPSPSSSEANKYIMPGQAFFVQNNAEINQAPSITFTENAKVTAQSQTSVFSTIDEFYVNFRLYKSSALQNDESESDAIGLRFADYYTTPSSDEDASKLANPGENFAVVNDKFTSIDKRAMPLDNEEIELFISGYEAQNYDIKFMLGHQPEDIKLYLNDNYLESSVEITDDMLYSFSVDSNSPASIAADRFYISFENVTMGTTQPNLADAIRIYPNPVANVLNIDVKNYEIEKLKIFNIQGQELNSVSSTKSINVSSLKSGVYILKVYTNQGTSVQKFIKK